MCGAVRPVCPALRHGADRASRLPRPATAARGGRRRMRAAGGSMRFGAMLDLGCGTGLAGAAFRPQVDRLTGVDLSPAMIAQARARASMTGWRPASWWIFSPPKPARRRATTSSSRPMSSSTSRSRADRRRHRARAGARRPVRFHGRDPRRRRRAAAPTLRYAHGADYVRAGSPRPASSRRISPKPRCAPKRRAGRAASSWWRSPRPRSSAR